MASEATSVWRRRWVMVAEVALVVAILGLLVLTWLPALIGAHPASPPR